MRVASGVAAGEEPAAAVSSATGYNATMPSSSQGDQVNPATGLTAASELPAISTGMNCPATCDVAAMSGSTNRPPARTPTAAATRN